MVAAVCAIKRRSGQKFQTFSNAVKNYAETFELNTILSSAKKNLTKQGYQIENLGHVTSVEQALEVCKQKKIPSLYIAEHQITQISPTDAGEISIQYI